MALQLKLTIWDDNTNNIVCAIKNIKTIIRYKICN